MQPIENSRDSELATTVRDFKRKYLVQIGLGAMRSLLFVIASVGAFSVFAHAQEAGTDPFEAQATATTTSDSASTGPAPAAIPDASAPSTGDAKLFQQLREKQSRILVLESEVKEAELRRKLAELAAPTSALPLGLDLSNPAVAATYKSFPAPAADTSGNDLSPYVLKLNGSLGHMSALILMPDNSTINARPKIGRAHV